MGPKHTALVFADKAARLCLSESRMPTYYGGKWIWLGKRSWSSLYLAYEPSIAQAVKDHLQPGNTFWDVGANVGLFSLLAARLTGSKGRIVAFEPAPAVFELLNENVATKANITAVQCGIGNADGHATMSTQGVSSSNSFIPQAMELTSFYHPGVAVEQTMVPIRRLDSVAKEGRPLPDLIKVDIEGFEVEAMKGAKGLLGDRRAKLIIEIHPVQLKLGGSSEEELLDLLRDARYSAEVISNNAFGLYSILAKPD